MGIGWEDEGEGCGEEEGDWREVARGGGEWQRRRVDSVHEPVSWPGATTQSGPPVKFCNGKVKYGNGHFQWEFVKNKNSKNTHSFYFFPVYFVGIRSLRLPVGATRSDCLVQFSILNPFFGAPWIAFSFMCPPPSSPEPHEFIA